MSKIKKKRVLGKGWKFPVSNDLVQQLLSGFHGALNEEILHCVSKTPGLDRPASEEPTCAFLSAADRANTLVRSSAQRSSDLTGMSKARRNVSRHVFPADSSDSSCFHVGYRYFHSSSSESQKAEHEANVNPWDRAPQAAESGKQLRLICRARFAGKVGELAQRVPLPALQ